MYKHFLFSEDAGANGGAESAPTGAENSNAGKDGGEPKPQTFSEMLEGNKDYQKELDRRINKAVETATENERKRQQFIQDNYQKEVERVAKMTQAEKDEYFKHKAEKEAEDREAALTKRELTLDARATLQDKHLPDSFISLLDYSSKEACNKSIDVLDVAFRAAVQDAVNEKLKGNPAPKDARTEGDGKKTPEDEAKKELDRMRKIAHLRTK